MKVHIVGGGIGGMVSALHLAELAREGHLDEQVEIIIHEASSRLGGKSSSQLEDFPGEHGFRFFPNFYRCIPDTLGRIPISSAHRTKRSLRADLGSNVLSLLADAPDGSVAIGELTTYSRSAGLAQLPAMVASFFKVFDLSPFEALKFSGLLMRFLSSCDARMMEEYENETLETFFFQRHGMSDNFRRFLAILRALSAMRSNRGSLRTLLFTATQMMVDFNDEYRAVDAVLPGPTDWMMLEPWEDRLKDLGVSLNCNTRLERLDFRAGTDGAAPSLVRAHLRGADGVANEIQLESGDFLIMALPFEVARRVLAASGELPPGLRGALRIEQRADNLGDGAEPMVGFQFFLNRPSGLPRGHILYARSEWAMTSVAQGQFWEQSFSKPLADVFGVPGLQDIVSAIVSGWDAPGDGGRQPRNSSKEQLIAEVLRQINAGLGPEHEIKPEHIIASRVDSDIDFQDGNAFCPTPLWVSPAGSYLSRSSPDPGCSNFFIASDWARTQTDVGSMESADEAARLAVQGLIQRAPLPPPDSRVPRVAPLRLWKVLEDVRKVDVVVHSLGLPNLLSINSIIRTAIFKSVTKELPEEPGDLMLELIVQELNKIDYDPQASPTEQDLNRVAEILSGQYQPI